MNCDQVFDILTRGPFPTGTECDEPVELHLSQCDECHRLAEALRPALELFQEAVDPEESRDLPGYWTAAAGGAVISSAPDVEARRAQLGAASPAGVGWSAPVALRAAALVAVGVTLGMLFGMRAAWNGGAWLPSGGGGDQAPLALPAERQLDSLLDQLQLASLPAACAGDQADRRAAWYGDSEPAGGPATSALACCSGCHHAQAELTVSVAATATVARSCKLCHASSMQQSEMRRWRPSLVQQGS